MSYGWWKPMADQQMARPPSEQWWCINGASFMAALDRAHLGESPEVVYLECLVNSDTTDYGKGGDA